MNSLLFAPYTRAYSCEMSIAARLDEAMHAAGFRSQSALARASGVPQPTINRILKGTGKRGPETNTIKALAEACKVSAQWLTDGSGVRHLPSSDEGDNELGIDIRDDDGGDFVRVQVVQSFLHAGLDGIDGDFEPDEDADPGLVVPRSWLVGKGLSPRCVKAIRIKGLSMYPTFKPGAIVLVNLADRVMVDGELFAVNTDGKSVIKRLELEGGIWYLASDNTAPEFKRRAIRDNDSVIAGRVVMAIASFV